MTQTTPPERPSEQAMRESAPEAPLISPENAARGKLHERVENDLILHPPVNDTVSNVMDALRKEFKDLAHTVIELTPASRDQSLALTNIEYGLRDAIAAVAKNQHLVDPADEEGTMTEAQLASAWSPQEQAPPPSG